MSKKLRLNLADIWPKPSNPKTTNSPRILGEYQVENGFQEEH
jgi:hypothetical protein